MKENDSPVATYQIWMVPANQVAYFCRRDWTPACRAPAKMMYEFHFLPMMTRKLEKIAENILEKQGYEERITREILEETSSRNSEDGSPAFENYTDEDVYDAQTQARTFAMEKISAFVRRRSIEFTVKDEIWFVLTRERIGDGEWI